ncbi:helix-turn-helix domain-containing protein [Citreicella sp. C3M06]|uniref:helix-turn-helix domain-containing protein n=1 Tax=Citreicella sp. C3M06 TaxID=2841564 RepID=UPI002091372A|nr:helix-turn-helix domain-containing protein [Citreicella sp. C3M06]
MTHQNSVAHGAGAQETCAQPAPLTGASYGAICDQPRFAPISRRDLMVAVNTVARDLGLRAASVVVIDALLSCLPCRDPKTRTDRPITPDMLLTIYAANDTLCFRARGITDRQLRRHLAKLEDIGMIQRRDSANGKRFPVHRAGKIVGAFGIDLSPLLAQAATLVDRARKRREQDAELRGLRAIIGRLRQDCLALPLDEAQRDWVEQTRALVRRASITPSAARDLLRRIQTLIATRTKANPAPEPEQTPATDGQNVRHKERNIPDTKKPCDGEDRLDWSEMPTLASFYPDPPRTRHALHQIIFGFGKMLGIEDALITAGMARLGGSQVLRCLDRIAEDIERIKHPSGYFNRIVMSDARI